MNHIRPQHGFVALGGVCTALGGQHLLLEGEGLGTALESAIVLALAGVVFYTARDLPRWDISRNGGWRALRISVAAAGSFAALAVIVWSIWLLEGNAFELSFLVSFAASLGASVGSRAGLYVVEADERLTEARELATLLSITQRVLRHNIRNELSVALGHLERIEDEDDPAPTPETVATIRDHLDALVETSDRTRRISDIWRTDAVGTFDLTAVVEREVERLRSEAPGASVETDLPERCRVRAHPELPLAVAEALRNAVEHNADDVEVSVRVRRLDGDAAELVVADTGTGIPTSERATLGNAEETPLEHTDGVGLWTIFWVVRRSDGAVAFEDNDPRGTVVRITLPAAT